MELLYPAFSMQEATFAINLLMLASINIIFLSVTQIYSAMLQALDKAFVPLVALIAGLAVKVVLLLVLTPRIGIYGAAISNTSLFATSAIINGIYFRYYLGGSKTRMKNLLKIFACGVIMGAVALMLYQLIDNRIVRIIVAPSVPLVIFFFAILFSKIFTREELRSLPLGNRIESLTEKLVGFSPE
jgi:PST family polysaccharide transporter